jgi:hypothetical protein
LSCCSNARVFYLFIFNCDVLDVLFFFTFTNPYVVCCLLLGAP